MKHLLIGMLVLIAVTSTGCSLFSSQPSEPPADVPASEPVYQPAQPAVPVSATLPRPLAKCQSSLGGKITDNATQKSPANISVEIASGTKKFQTKTDANGLYGFAGLCAGQYEVSITPPGRGALANVSRVTLDGANPGRLDLTY